MPTCTYAIARLHAGSRIYRFEVDGRYVGQLALSEDGADELAYEVANMLERAAGQVVTAAGGEG